MPDTEPQDAAGPKSLGRALDLLKFISSVEPHGSRLMDIAEQNKLNRGTAHRLLSGLIDAGLVEQPVSGGRYFLGPEAIVMARSAKLRVDWTQMTANSLRRVVAAAQDVVLLTLRSGNDAVIIERLEGNFPLRTHVAKLGDRHPVGVGAAWIAMLAEMVDEEVDRLLKSNPARDQKFQQFSDASIWSLIREARSRGYALNPGFIFEGSWAMALPITLERGRPLAAITIAALANRLTPERQLELLPILRREVDVVSEMVSASHRV